MPADRAKLPTTASSAARPPALVERHVQHRRPRQRVDLDGVRQRRRGVVAGPGGIKPSATAALASAACVATSTTSMRAGMGRTTGYACLKSKSVDNISTLQLMGNILKKMTASRGWVYGDP